jgi:hypothetical protein
MATENFNPDEIVNTELQNYLTAQENGGAPPVETAPQPIKLNIGGAEQTFNNPQELEAAFTSLVSNQYQTEQKLKELEAKSSRYVETDETPKFNDQEYFKKLTESPAEAQNYLLSHALFDGKTKDALGTLKQFIQDQQQTKTQVEVYKFRSSHPEFDQNPMAEAQIEAVRQQLNLPATAQGFELAYAQAQIQGRIPAYSFAPPQGQQPLGQAVGATSYPPQTYGQNPFPNQYGGYGAQGVNPQFNPRPTGPTPPPSTRLPANPTIGDTDILRAAETMPIEKLREILAKANL